MHLGPIPSGKGFKKKAKKAVRSAKRKTIDLIEDIAEDPRPKHGSRVRKAIDMVEGMHGGSVCGAGSCGCGAPQPPSRLPSGNLASAGKSSREMSGGSLRGMHGHARFARALYDKAGGFHGGFKGGKLNLGHTIKKGWEHTTHGVASAAKAVRKHAPGLISEGLDIATPAALTAIGSAFGNPELGAAAPIARAGVKAVTGYGGSGSGRFAKGSAQAKEWAKKMREARMGGRGRKGDAVKKAQFRPTEARADDIISPDRFDGPEDVITHATERICVEEKKEIERLRKENKKLRGDKRAPSRAPSRPRGENRVPMPKTTVAELKAIAKRAGIKGFSKMTKQQLLDVIRKDPNALDELLPLK